MTTNLDEDLRTLFDAQTRSLGLGAQPGLERSMSVRTYSLEPDAPRTGLWWAAAAVAIVGVAGLVSAVAVRGNDTEPPAVNQPGPSSVPAAPPSYPLFGGAALADATVTADEWTSEVYDPPVLHATLGRVADNRVSDIVHLTIATVDTPQSPMTGAERSEETVSGKAVTRYSVDSPEPIPDTEILEWNVDGFRLTMNDSPVADLLIDVLTPVISNDDRRSIELQNPLANLPPDWELLDEPAGFDRATGPNLSATTEDGSSVTLHVWPTLMMSGSDWSIVQIGTERAFLNPPHEGVSDVDVAGLAWRTPNGDWAVLTGVGDLAHQLQTVSGDITWVDYGTWQDRYGPVDTDNEPQSSSPTETTTAGTGP